MKALMKRSIATTVTATLVVLIITTLVSASAQRPVGFPSETETLEEELAMFKERLALSDEQTEQIQRILLENRKKISALMEDVQASPRSRSAMQSIRQEMEDLRKKTEQELEAVLTEEQLKKYKKMQDEQQEKMGGAWDVRMR